MNSLSICKTIIQSIKTLLHYREFLDSHRHKNRFIRSSGKLSMYHVIVYLLTHRRTIWYFPDSVYNNVNMHRSTAEDVN